MYIYIRLQNIFWIKTKKKYTKYTEVKQNINRKNIWSFTSISCNSTLDAQEPIADPPEGIRGWGHNLDVRRHGPTSGPTRRDARSPWPARAQPL